MKSEIWVKSQFSKLVKSILDSPLWVVLGGAGWCPTELTKVSPSPPSPPSSPWAAWSSGHRPVPTMETLYSWSLDVGRTLDGWRHDVEECGRQNHLENNGKYGLNFSKSLEITRKLRLLFFFWCTNVQIHDIQTRNSKYFSWRDHPKLLKDSQIRNPLV